MMTLRSLMLIAMIVTVNSCGPKKTEVAVDDSKPQYGGTFIYGKNGAPLTLDPALTKETESTVICDNVYEGLVQQRAGKIAIDPCLAKSWDISKDGMTLTFHLRTDVKFHDGTPFNAEAAVFSFDRQSNPKNPYHGKLDFDYWRSFDMDRVVKSTRAVNDSTFEVRLHARDATFLNLISMNFMGIVSPTAVKRYNETFFKNPVGTGAFRFVSWDDEGTVITVANENYWGGRPFLDTIVFKPIPNAKLRWTLLKAGEISMMGVPDQSDIPEIQNTPGVQYSQQPGINVAYMAMNMTKKPFDNLKVREAIVYAINRDKIVKEVYAQLGRAAKNPIPPSLLGYKEDIPFTPYDPAKAKQLLTEAGFPNGFKCALWTLPVTREYMPNGKLAAELIQKDLLAVGIETNLIIYPFEEYLTRRGNAEHDLIISGWVGDAPDPHFFFYPLLDKSSAEKRPSNNAAFYKSEEMHQLILKGKETIDPVERSNVYKKACEVFNKDLPWFVIAHALAMVPMRDNVKNFQPHSSSVRKFDKVWLKK
jgi:peptide/nickel transport system substrate-binding protein